MLRIVLLILMILAGILILRIGYKEIKGQSAKENILEVIFIFLGDSDITAVGTLLIGLVLIILGILGIVFGWGK